LDSATSPRDFAGRPGKSMASPPYIPYLHVNRRPSLATDSYPPLHSASTTESYSSPDGFSPSTITTGTSNTTPSERSTRMSVEGGRTPIFPPPTPGGPGSTLNPSVGLPPLTSQSAGTSPINLQLPPPSPAGGVGNVADIQTVPLHGPAGGYKCEYEGCSAAPFQTQYLLKYVGILTPILAPASPLFVLIRASQFPYHRPLPITAALLSGASLPTLQYRQGLQT
jgi:hypothetical protein